MDKLTEKINTFVVSKELKKQILLIAELESLQIQQVCRRLLIKAAKEYINETKL